MPVQCIFQQCVLPLPNDQIVTGKRDFHSKRDFKMSSAPCSLIKIINIFAGDTVLMVFLVAFGQWTLSAPDDTPKPRHRPMCVRKY